MKKHFLALGECTFEQRAHDGQLYFAGDTFNTAYYLAHYAAELATVSYGTAIGVDAQSQQMKQFWLDCGIDVSAVGHIGDRVVGEYWIRLDDSGERRFDYNRAQSAARVMFSDAASWSRLSAAIQRADVIYLSVVTLAIIDGASRQALFVALEAAKQRGAQVIMDNNYRAALWSSAAECAACLHQFEPVLTHALYSLDDACDIAENQRLRPEEIVGHCLAAGIGQVVIKAGLRGYWLASTGESARHYDVEPVECVIDATAAGDSFNAGFITGCLMGKTMQTSALMGYRLAAAVVQQPGALLPHAQLPTIA